MALNTHSLPSTVEALPAETPRERLFRGGGWLTLLLALVMLFIVAASVEAAGWTDGLVVVQSAVLGGALVAFLLSLTSWGAGFSALYSLLAMIPWVTTALVRTLLPKPDLHDGILALINHYAQWFTTLRGGTASGDNWVFVIQLCIIAWWMAHFAVWSLYRHQRAWQAVLPMGVGIVFNAYYAPQDLQWYVIAFLIAALLLAVRVELARNESRWQMERIRYAPDMYLDFLKEGLLFAGIVVVAAWWMMPVMNTSGTKIDDVIQPLRQPWHEVQDNWQRMFSSLKYKQTAVASTYGKSMRLSGPVELSDQPVFAADSPTRSYWRGAAYDTYTGQQWLNTDQEVMSFDSGVRYREPIYAMMGAITATIQTLQDGQNVIFGPPSPMGSSLGVNADVTVISGDEATNDQQITVSLLRSRVNLKNRDTYRVVSAVSLAPPDSLRADNTNYPDWITQRYLQVPAELPARVRRLAQRVTRGANNPYDKASAIESYLRQYPYNTQIAAPPPGEDGVAYFLFDVKEGYCDYYASSMVIMLRTLGIPARFVAGYAPGTYDEESGRYIVKEEAAHAWPEVFFPTYGWVQFEPTASQPNLVRPTQAPPTPTPNETGTVPDPNQNIQDMLDQRLQHPDMDPGIAQDQSHLASPIAGHEGPIAAGALSLALAAGLGIVAWRWNKRMFVPDHGLLMRLFALFGRWAERLRIPWRASQTPMEHAHAFSQVFPEVSAPIDRLTDMLVAQQYGRQEFGPESLRGLAGDWRVLQPVLWRRWAKQYLKLPAWLKRYVRAK